jgi:hypothetical protein
MKPKNNAFSRVDLLLCLFSVTLLFLMAASLFASNKSDSQRVICFNNLRQIGRAFHVWGNDRNDYLPWQVISQQPPEGGVQGQPLSGNVWWQFSWISNQLGSPKLLTCPADAGTTKVASEWSTTAMGGFLNPAYRNNSVSYPLFLHAQPNAPASLLSGDRNFRVDNLNMACSFVPLHSCFGLQPGGRGAWTNAIHGLNGHLLFMEGSVRFTSSTEFQKAVSLPLHDDGGALHGLQVR